MSTYSPILRTELIGDGQQPGAWGATTNSNFQYIFESAIAGIVTVTVSPSSNNQVLTYTNGPSSTAALDQTVYGILKLNAGTLSANFNVFAPPVSKTYIVWNNTSYTAIFYNSTIIGNTTAAGSGIAVPPGVKVQIWSDGTNFWSDNASTGDWNVFGNLSVAGTSSANNFNVNGNLSVAGTSSHAGVATFSTNVNFAGGSGVSSTGDLSVRRSSGTNGVIFFGNGTPYLIYDGSNFTFSGGAIYGTGTGLTGTASSLTAGSVVVSNSSVNTAFPVPFLASGNVFQNMNLTYNPALNWLTAGQFNGSGAGLTGTAASLTAGSANALNASNGYTVASLTSNGPVYIDTLRLLRYDGSCTLTNPANGNGVRIVNQAFNAEIWHCDNDGNTSQTSTVTATQFNGSGAGLTGTAASLTAGSANGLNSGLGYTVAGLTVNNTVTCYVSDGTAAYGWAMACTDHRIGGWSVGSAGGSYLQVYVDGSAYGISLFPSDESIKKNITASTYDALDTVNKINFKEFDYNEEKTFAKGHVDCGLTSQQLEQVDPSLVFQIGDLKQPNESKLLYIALKAIQELEAKVAALEAKLAK